MSDTTLGKQGGVTSAVLSAMKDRPAGPRVSSTGTTSDISAGTGTARRLNLTVVEAVGTRAVARAGAGSLALELPMPARSGMRLTLVVPPGDGSSPTPSRGAGTPTLPLPGSSLSVERVDGETPKPAVVARVIDIRDLDVLPRRPPAVHMSTLVMGGKPVAGATAMVGLEPAPALVARAAPPSELGSGARPAPPAGSLPGGAQNAAPPAPGGGAILAEALPPAMQMRGDSPMAGRELPTQSASKSTSATASIPADGPSTASGTEAGNDTRGATSLIARVTGRLPDGRPLLDLGRFTLAIEETELGIQQGSLVGVRPQDLPRSLDLQASADDVVDALLRVLLGRAGQGGDAPLPGRIVLDDGLASRLMSLHEQIEQAPGRDPAQGTQARRDQAPASGMERDQTAARSAMIEVNSEGWRGLAGVLAEEAGIPALLSQWQRRRDRESSEDHAGDDGHMVLAIELSQIGRVRIEIFSHDEHLNAVVTTERDLTPPLRREIIDLFGAALELTGLEGRLTFRVDLRRAGPPGDAALATNDLRV